MKNTIIISILFLVFFNIQAQTIRYVAQNGAGNLSGTSWANASNDLQAMITASVTGNQVWVAAGTYSPTKDPFGNANPTDLRDKTFYMKNGVKVYGGFAGNETNLAQRTDSVIVANETILSGAGDNTYHVVLSVSDINGTTINGFTITSGNAENGTDITVEGANVPQYNGGGICIIGGAISVSKCIISGNSSYLYSSSGGEGGGIYNSGNGDITDCQFLGNTASGYGYMSSGGRGGGLYNLNNGDVINCYFSYNNAAGTNVYGGGIYNAGGGIINDCIFEYNGSNGSGFGYSPGAGGAIYNESGNIQNCSFYNNSSGDNGGALFNNGFGNVSQCLFSDNSSDWAGAIYNNSIGDITNCIFTNNSGSAVKNVAFASTFINCLFYANNWDWRSNIQ